MFMMPRVLVRYTPGYEGKGAMIIDMQAARQRLKFVIEGTSGQDWRLDPMFLQNRVMQRFENQNRFQFNT